ncbi:hypothetical protein BGX31_009565 [Mortierella sp. GBA43]|nr:hypothetical protein BGX31_009565 [Mortierella sp. GBA43]
MSPQPDEGPKPEVLIVGAGLGGLLLAQLLEQINVPYHIYELTAEAKPLGSAMALGPSIFPVFEQLGLMEELEKISLPYRSTVLYTEDMKKIGSMDMSGHEKLLGYEQLVFSRPRLYDLLQSRVPAHKISRNKKVLRISEKNERVQIYCSDNSCHEGDILVGADGTFSAVRQNLFKQLQEQQGWLHKEDESSDFVTGAVILVGIAEPAHPEKYPQLKEPVCDYSNLIEGNGERVASVISAPGNQICWAVAQYTTDADLAKTRQFRNSHWEPLSNEDMYKAFEDMSCPWGGTMGDIMKHTPKDRISKLYPEAKLFKTWYHGRTVLMGDGAINAMQDAVVLANCIYNLKDISRSSITAAFQEYYRQRYTLLDAQIKHGQMMNSVLGGKTLVQRITRHLVFNYIPQWVQDRQFVKAWEYRPQLAWLPLVPNRGTGHVLPQEGPRIEDRQREQHKKERQ